MRFHFSSSSSFIQLTYWAWKEQHTQHYTCCLSAKMRWRIWRECTKPIEHFLVTTCVETCHAVIHIACECKRTTFATGLLTLVTNFGQCMKTLLTLILFTLFTINSKQFQRYATFWVLAHQPFILIGQTACFNVPIRISTCVFPRWLSGRFSSALTITDN